ncbi:terminase TerL endonuclease subunit [Listeria booriae]|uniref:terminase TerL endonuclease subunit n=1 Tax=Listeria booriae TaxID=1552123 RepID=UPI001627692D|nr:terminase TerL endonuclease subunit [Listeria booriae]MBC1247340.1 terminase large subunit [Listeria booriae]
MTTCQTYKYHPYIDAYFKYIRIGQLKVCKEQKKLVRMIKHKLDNPNVMIDHEAIEDSVNIPAPYFSFTLYPWQKFVNACIFGVRYKDTGRLVWNQILIMMGRGGGKNGYAAYLSFYMMSKQFKIKHYHIEFVATSEKQAKTSFIDIKNVLDDPAYEKQLKKIFAATKVLIQHRFTKAQVQYHTANAKTKDGLRPDAIFFDEIHEYEGKKLIKVFRSALGKVPDGRTFYLTTDGYLRGGFLDDMKDKAKHVLDNFQSLPKNKLFPFICKLDNEKQVIDPTNWEMANPSLPHNSELYETMLEEWDDCQVDGLITDVVMHAEFLTKRMNFPVEMVKHQVATYEDVLATNQAFPKELEGATAIAGVDFADVRDFCTVGLLFKYKGKRYWIQHTFIHHLALKLQDINPDIIEIAKSKGLCTIIETDKSIKPERVVNWFKEKLQTYGIQKVAMDTFRESILGAKLKEAGFEVDVVRRGNVTHSKLAPMIDDMFINQTIVFPDDPLMRWFVGNVYVDELGNGNKEYKKIDKEKRKTDGFFAFTHALNFDHELVEQSAWMDFDVFTY